MHAYIRPCTRTHAHIHAYACIYVHAYVSSSARCLTATLWLRPLVRTHLYNKREQISTFYYLFVPVPPRWTIRVGGRAHITKERQSELTPLSTKKNNRRPPSWRSPPLWDRGGSTLNPLGLCNRASLSAKAGPRHMKGPLSLGLRASLWGSPNQITL
jgi:hypothetical protein